MQARLLALKTRKAFVLVELSPTDSPTGTAMRAGSVRLMMLTNILRSAHGFRIATLGGPVLARSYSRAVPMLQGVVLNDDDLFAEPSLTPPAGGADTAPKASNPSTQAARDGMDSSSTARAAVDAFLGSRVPFAELGIRPQLVSNLDQAGFACSTAIQARAAAPVLAGEDCVVIAAETGSGKTLSYMLPLMERLLRQQEQPGGASSSASGAVGNSQGAEKEGPWTAGPTTVASLKARCVAMGVAVSGTKAELLARLLEAGEPQAVAAAEGDRGGVEPPAGEGMAAPASESLESFPRALVLAPNRELVQQVLAMAAPLTSGTGLRLGAVRSAAPGSPWPYVKHDARSGRTDRSAPDILVTTPAFVAEHAKRESGALMANCECLVLDEADMLLEGGFLSQVEMIILARQRAHRDALKAAAGGRQLTRLELKEGIVQGVETNPRPLPVVLAAATLPNYGLKSIDERVKKLFPGAVQVENELLHRAQPQLQQAWVDRDDGRGAALPQLAQLLVQDDSESSSSAAAAAASTDSGRVRRVMVFCNTAAAAAACSNGLAQALEDAGLWSERGRRALVLPYHKEVLPDTREEHLRAFAAGPGVPLPSLSGTGGSSSVGDDDDDASNGGGSSGGLRILVCTDLASRGLDLGIVDHVVQFDFALNVVQHVHRLGRSGRCGRAGKATHFVSPDGPQAMLADMIRTATEAGEPLEESFSRQRGFRKKIKKTGAPRNANANKPRGGF